MITLWHHRDNVHRDCNSKAVVLAYQLPPHTSPPCCRPSSLVPEINDYTVGFEISWKVQQRLLMRFLSVLSDYSCFHKVDIDPLRGFPWDQQRCHLMTAELMSIPFQVPFKSHSRYHNIFLRTLGTLGRKPTQADWWWIEIFTWRKRSASHTYFFMSVQFTSPVHIGKLKSILPLAYGFQCKTFFPDTAFF